jgi:hypothetical protein
VNTFAQENRAECVGVFRISVEDQMPFAAQKASVRIGDVACNLRHPRIVWMRSDAGDVYGSRGDVDKEQDVMRDKASDA